MAHPWHDAWFDHAAAMQACAWRAVEAQHVVATMRLVDTVAEQDVLEQLLEASKPPLPSAARGQHHLLAMPFRYRPRHGSRFRRAGSKGIWYGADSVATACAEVAYWRWRFLVGSAGLPSSELLTEHTVFAAGVDGLAIDLTSQPWLASRTRWTSPGDHGATQALAEAARERRVQWIRHESVRRPGGVCCAVFDPQALSGPDLASRQTWHCRTTRDTVRMVHDGERHEWRFEPATPAVPPRRRR